MTKRERQSHNECSRKKVRLETLAPKVAVELSMPESYSDPDSGFFEDDDIDTHPRSFDHHHVDGLQTFTNDLHQALQGSFPPLTCPYTAVHVLLLRWDEDDLGVHTEISRLKSVFEDQFRFHAEEWNIPTSDPYHLLQDKIFHFQKSHQNPSELLILYYGGHSDPDTRRGRSIWHANCTATTPSLEWFNIQPMLLTARPHVLMILDCCYAANAARDTTEGSSKELLAACGRENQTPSVGIRSFTSVLIEELQSFGCAAFTVAMLHARLITLRHTLAHTPIYAALAEKGGNSIVISPFPRDPSPSPLGLGGSTGPSFDTDTADGTSAQEQLNTVNDTTTALPTAVSLTEGTRVLLAVSVAEDVAHNVAQWVSWLTTAAPWDVSKVDVQLECMYKSHSTLLLVSVPIVGWDRLPESAAYRFIGFIKSGNLICEKANPRPIAKKILQPTSTNTSFDQSLTGTRTDRKTFTNAHQGHSYAPVITNTYERHLYEPVISKPVASQTLPTPKQIMTCTTPGADHHSSHSHSRKPENVQLLVRARQEGMNWQPIASKYFPDKTANVSRKRHERLMDKRNQYDEWEGAKTDTVARAYNDAREQLWKPLADRVGETWQTVEAKCMGKGLESLQTIAQESSPHLRSPNANIGLDDDETTLTPRSPEETRWYDSGRSVDEDHHSGQPVRIKRAKSPYLSNVFDMPSKSFKTGL